MDEPEEMPVTITDKRGQKKDETVAMPTAQELLDSGSENPALAAQLAEEQERLARWEAMTDEEKQAELARQAAEVEGVPFQGGGMQAPPDEHAGKKQVLTMFTIVVHNDGTALASDDTDLSKFEPQFPVDANMIYRAVCEIKKDIESTAAGTATLMAMNAHAQHMQQEMQARALAEQLGQRGHQVPHRGKRR
jgi:hypothetical protein